MKNKIFLKLTLIVACMSILYACKKSFLDHNPLGALDENVLANEKGVDGLLIASYSLLDGYGAGGNWDASGSNWVYGSVVGGDAHKGSDAGDQGDIVPIEKFVPQPTNGYFNNKWRTVYEGVVRCNNTIKILAKATGISEANRKRITGEARFLRGHYQFEAKKMWGMVPYVDETNTVLKPANDKDIWPSIEADFQFAYDNLPELQDKIGRANKWAAGAYLAKTKMFRKDFAGAKPLLEMVIANGKNSKGIKYALNPRFDANFDADTKNSPEAVFSVQYSVNDGANGDNGGFGDVLNFTYTGGPGGCCGFFQPTQDLVNSFQTTSTGLPISVDNNFPTGGYNVIRTVKNDQGIKSNEAFTPETGTLDPRLDWTVGRRGIPYRDWGAHPGQQWIRDQAYSGPYAPIKNTYKKSQEGVLTDKSFWTSGVTANNYTLIRLADVILWAAECEVEVGSLDKARDYVNMIRSRAANPAGFVKVSGGANAANYIVSNYTLAWASKDEGRKAVHFERKLELAMEGHRFFDLVRWGEAEITLNAYVAYEKTLRNFLNGVTFKPTNIYFPIPQTQIDQSSVGGTATLKQNPGY